MIIYEIKMFEFDSSKSAANLEKHGIDFEEAQKLWDGPVFAYESAYTDEPRILVVGIIKGRFWTAIITNRNENIRIISCRRSRESEIALWQGRYKP